MAEERIESQSLSSTTDHQPVSEHKAITQAAGVVGFWTTLSRVLGFVRDMVIALFLGAGLGADAFFVAFRIPNLLRRLFAEGALSAAFIPTFVDTLQRKGITEAARLARITISFAAIVLAIVTVICIIFSPWLVRVTAPGFFENPVKFNLTVDLTRIMFPYIFLISLVALASGVLNSLRHFAAPAAAPVVLNISMIFSVAFFCRFFNVEPYMALAWGVIAGGILQLLLQVPFMNATGVRIRPDFHFKDPTLKRIGRLFVPAAFSGGVSQINVLVGTVLASLLAQGSVSWLWYADRIVELPLGVFAIALGTAVLPSMSRQASNGDLPALRHSVTFSLRLIGFFIIPASIGLILLREPIVAVLFQRGLFTVVDTRETAYALLWYTVGLWAFSGLRVVTQAFFSLKDTRTPLWVSIGAVIVNVVAGVLLMGPMAQGGLALATSLAAAFNLLLLFAILAKRLGGFPSADLLDSLARTSVASLLMGGFLFYSRSFGTWEQGLNFVNGPVLAGCIIGGLVIYGAASYLLGGRELKAMFSLLKGK
ncbi:MAG: murein biosynthesis integral membrane protein MurJ [Desulfomonile tiedjei]|nr:murein biosynthesis integral membrane protein MurJ [Desulfomonile tiedjei]